MTHSCMCHDSSICLPWLIHTCAMTHPWIIHATDYSCLCHKPSDLTLDSELVTDAGLLHMCAMTYSYVCHDLSIRVPRLIRMCAMTHQVWTSIQDSSPTRASFTSPPSPIWGLWTFLAPRYGHHEYESHYRHSPHKSEDSWFFLAPKYGNMKTSHITL